MREESIGDWLADWRQEKGVLTPQIAAELSRTYSIISYFARRFLKHTMPLAANIVGPALPS